MKKIIVLTFMTLDGVMQAPGGPEEDTSGGFEYGGWSVPYFDDFMGKVMADQLSKPFDLLLGRKTYDIFAAYWPHHNDELPEINQASKYVASRKPQNFTWEKSILLRGDIAEAVRQLKSGDGPDLQVHGSGDFIQTLLKHDLVDEFWLKIFPITLGKGKRLFADGTIPAAFSIAESAITPQGVIVVSYKRAGDIKVGSF
jgi:dihydrofolate reductase